MIPERAILLIRNAKFVRETFSCRNAALREADGAVHFILAMHVEAMPVEREGFVLCGEGVLDVHFQSITGADFDGWSGELAWCVCKS